MLRNNLRPVSALVLLAFVVCHLVAHSLLLVSLDQAEAGLYVLTNWSTFRRVASHNGFNAQENVLSTTDVSGMDTLWAATTI